MLRHPEIRWPRKSLRVAYLCGQIANTLSTNLCQNFGFTDPKLTASTSKAAINMLATAEEIMEISR
jgi:hypothetical protein